MIQFPDPFAGPFAGVLVPDGLPPGRYFHGQIVRHRRSGWRALDVEGDVDCTADEAWYFANQDRGPRLLR